MSKREKEKSSSLDALAKFAYAASGGNPAPAKPAAPKSARPAPAPKKAAPPAPAYKPETAADRKRKLQIEERRAKLEEEKALKARRAGELARGSKLEWRGMWTGGDMPGVRRTAFDRVEPSLDTKIHGVLGAAAEKEGRAKNRDKGKRQGGR